MRIETQLSDQVARYLDLSSAQTKLTAVNMANVDTPGYRAMGMNFEEEMKKAMAGVDSGASPDSISVLPEGELVARPDGNNVSMDREGLTMAEAQLRFKTGVSLLHEEYQKVLNAIHAQDK